MLKKYIPIIDKLIMMTLENYLQKQNAQEVKAFLETLDDQSLLFIEAFNYPHLLARTAQTIITNNSKPNAYALNEGNDGKTRIGKTSEKPDPNEIVQAVVEKFSKDWKGRDVELHVIEGFCAYFAKAEMSKKVLQI